MPEILEIALEKYKGYHYDFPNNIETLLGGAAPILLLFNMQKQLENQWCWAATSTSVSLFYNPASGWTQCLVAEQIMGSGCCMFPAPCDYPSYLDQALSTTENYVAMSGTMSFSQIENELSQGRVIGARVGWNGGGGHFMVIYGCRQSTGIKYLSIDDPIYGKSELPESTFLNAYRSAGKWTHSYTTKPQQNVQV